MLDLQYHDIRREKGLYFLLERRGKVERIVSDVDIEKAMVDPPQNTRAKMRGELIKLAKKKRIPYDLDWNYIRIGYLLNLWVKCNDPFQEETRRSRSSSGASSDRISSTDICCKVAPEPLMPKDVSPRIRLALLYGGRSGEHDVSIASAASVMQAIDAEIYEILPVYLTPQGGWLPGGRTRPPAGWSSTRRRFDGLAVERPAAARTDSPL